MKLSQKSKTLIIIGLVLLLLSVPLGFMGSQIIIRPDCSDSYLPSVCAELAKPLVWAVITGATALIGSITIAVAFIFKKK